MELGQLSAVQQEILKAIQQLSGKQMFTEAVLAKKIRENNKLSGKNKAVIALNDLETVLEFMSENQEYAENACSVHLNSAHDLLIKKDEEFKMLTGDARKRRQSSEKSMVILTNRDFSENSTKKHNSDKSGNYRKGRQESRKMNIYDNEDSWER